MDTGLAGKSVLITGASRNIGRATALMFAKEGARLMLSTRRSLGPLDDTAAACRAAGAEAATVLCDVSDEGQVGEMLLATERAYGGVDVLVNNATQRVQGPFLAQSPEGARRSP